jgi:hypothetical protein
MRATRAYIAGFGTAGSLLAGAAMMFVLASAVVAFRGWPQVGAADTPTGAVLVAHAKLPGASRAERGLLVAASTGATAADGTRAGRGAGKTGASHRAGGSRSQGVTVAQHPGSSVGSPASATPGTAGAPATAGCGSSCAPSVTGTVSSVIQNATGAVGSTVAAAGKTLGATVSGLTSAVAGKLAGLNSGLANVVSKTGTAVGGLLSNTTSAAGNAVSNVGKGLAGLLSHP